MGFIIGGARCFPGRSLRLQTLALHIFRLKLDEALLSHV